ncbi:hypothetical protein J3R30DRAFT_1808317 [Lentinula aciculospora]|uniref:Uncharacterized protein n=1 Tax=Lentinula aciculospora TaxID=153920 RepID=A0A9W9A259_9AGAR|nr:hypothetical protein J3R30DRAFT_1101312 [Lentinula aciculospora]KAJ4483610.1 hypothetical protein J3R30DRAFT_1808317 [Lentinula aciculospora]
MNPPDSLEKIFQRVEEESQKRAETQNNGLAVPEDRDKSQPGDITKLTPIDVQRLSSVKSRRRGSVSITRFGQLSDDTSTKDPPASTPPTSPTTIITALAAQSPFYQSQLLNTSHESIGSQASDNEGLHAEDDSHVTQVHRIAARQTLSRAVGSFLPRRLSRARSRPVIEDSDGTLVIGVSVQAATATIEELSSGDAESHLPSTTVTVGTSLIPKLHSKESKSSLRSTSSNSNWVYNNSWMAKAKDLTKKLRRKSGQPLTQPTT